MSEKELKVELPTRASSACETCICPTCIRTKVDSNLRKQKQKRRLCLSVSFLALGVIFYFVCITSAPNAISAIDYFLFDIANPFKGLTTKYYLAKAVREDLCPQEAQLFPEAHYDLWLGMTKEVGTSESYRTLAIQRLSDAVQIPTETFDTMDQVGVDPRWDAFGPFHEYLLETFPLIRDHLNVTRVNSWGLIHEWTGSDPSLKPILLTAHQEIGFEPARSIVLASGFDEEISGVNGAQQIARHLEQAYGNEGFAFLVDEGGFFTENHGTPFAVAGISEKGHMDVSIQVSSPGGHSSVPPDHTSIGKLAKLVVELEDSPIPVTVDRSTPIYNTLLCYATHAKSMDDRLRQVILRSRHSDVALWRIPGMVKSDKMITSAMGTTQAVDVINGGVKNNALPEQAWTIVNHRIATQSNVDAVKKRDSQLLRTFAKSFDLEYSAFDEKLLSGSSGTLKLIDSLNNTLEPAPISPTDEAPFKVLSGTIRASYETRPGVASEKKREIKVAPGIMTGNTDTRHYWGLSKHIFRYSHLGMGGKGASSGAYTVDERIRVDDYMEMIRFFITLVLNANDHAM